MKSLKICHISDLHNRHKRIIWSKEALGCDVLVISGDISGTGEESEVKNFFKWVKTLSFKYIILISGNHDRCFDPQKGEWENFLMPTWLFNEVVQFEKDGRNFYLENEECEIEGVRFYGSPITPTFGRPGYWAFNRDRNGPIDKYWDDIPEGIDVLITHGPPYLYGDRTDSGLFVGCEALRRRIKEVKPLLHFSGHIHEGYGYDCDGDTHYFNGSICNLRYEPINAPWAIEADFEGHEIKILNDEKNKSVESTEPKREEQDEHSGGEGV